MASTLAYEMQRAQAFIQAAMTDHANDDEPLPVFTWNGVEIPCVRGKVTKGKLFGAGGFTPDANLVLIVASGDLPDPGPQPDQFLTYRGDRFRIDTVATSAELASVTLTCFDPNRGTGIVEREM